MTFNDDKFHVIPISINLLGTVSYGAANTLRPVARSQQVRIQGAIYIRIVSHRSGMKWAWEKEECWLGRLKEPSEKPFLKSAAFPLTWNSLHQLGGVLEILLAGKQRGVRGRSKIMIINDVVLPRTFSSRFSYNFCPFWYRHARRILFFLFVKTFLPLLFYCHINIYIYS